MKYNSLYTYAIVYIHGYSVKRRVGKKNTPGSFAFI